MEKAAGIIQQQIGYRNRLWLKSAKNALGSAVSTFVEDIESIEKNGRKRGMTWAEGKSKQEKWQAKLAMGYMIPLAEWIRPYVASINGLTARFRRNNLNLTSRYKYNIHS